MSIEELKSLQQRVGDISNKLVSLNITDEFKLEIYPNSINELGEALLFIGKNSGGKKLYVSGSIGFLEKFEGGQYALDGTYIKECSLSNRNSKIIQDLFPFTKPICLGLNNSFGFGDRLGLANAAHIRSLENSDFKPILAQQSIRELTRTLRTPEMVMDAAVWAVFQEGYKKGFGSDADHLKTTEDIDLMISNGFTMFTFDPSEHVINEADSLSIADLEKKIDQIPWAQLKDTYEGTLLRYSDLKFYLDENFVIKPEKEDLLRAVIKYGNAVAHIYKLYSHLRTKYSDLQYEIEVSVDETESVTTPFEHFFMSSELNRLGVEFISLAPRFIGEFEKGIDYKGDIEVFKMEYLKHVKIAEHFGSYKISLHSGSDKFGVYNAIGSLHQGFTHVKTAGTSYLEALRVIGATEPGLMREILDYSYKIYENEKITYHVSADIRNIHSANEYDDNEMQALFDQNDARQILHVTFGRVLTEKKDGEYLFRDRILNCLNQNEDIHYQFLYKHFRKHLDPFDLHK
ncbi:MAG: hypothetical protein CVV23_01180 [Ignavibacteriae bacterium HGW-Ignavibacteriae-2]|nr:MAG: hypothetical protein CVV23_01180 [Ignavibacteriae bacterium HGW-Ignavibacteriae-2]